MPNRQQPSKWHHYVPSGYLANFTTSMGGLYGYNKRTGRSFQHAKPRDVAAADHFHTDPRREDPLELERRLDREFEAPLLRVINRVLGRVRLERAGLPPHGPLVTADEQFELAKFVALQMVRTQKTRAEMEQVAPKYRTSGMTLNDEDVGRYAHLGLLEQHMQDDFAWFGGTIAQNRLTFLVPLDNQAFWVSDHPTLVGRGTDDGRAFWGGVGLKDERLELYLPLAWDVTAVFVGKHVRRLPRVIEMRAEQVEQRNLMTFKAADVLVLGRSPIAPAP
ncbi:DUF4238 domain-containing protein [Deinococcus sp. YIM 134068]|uniref:DUF4238 domain-containing protein n=1 Tax=Deinococcus lichenicola TaxID=3118910 RepID=UPI002F93DB6C